MRRKFIMTAMVVSCCLLIISCSKEKNHHLPDQEQNEETVTPVGTVVGQPVRKSIGTNGGELASADGTIRVIIPAGALTETKEISIQTITNNLPEGIGNAYRITPHGQQFSKPVTIVFNYKQEDTVNTRPELLDIAFQDSTGTWQMQTNTTLNKTQRKLSTTTTHFSDWGYFKSIKLTPSAATVAMEASLELNVTTTFPRVDPDDFPPGTFTIKVLKKPRKLRPDEITGWNYTGEGSLEPEGSWAYYTAPDHEPAVNPEAAVVNIKMKRKGQFMLVSNITVLAGHGVDYLMVDEDILKPGNGKKCQLYLYGNFGADPGASKRTIKINGTTVDINLWSPKIIRCGIDEYISGAIEIISNNKTVARSVLRKFSGNFLYERFHGGVLNSGSSNALKETAEFKLVYRGFGQPCPANVDPLFEFDLMLAAGTEVKYTLKGAASVNTPPENGCFQTTSVSLPTTTGWHFIESPSLGHIAEFISEVKEFNGGISVKLQYGLANLIPGVRVQRSHSCGATSFDPPRPLGVGLEGFNYKFIDMEFWDEDEFKLKGTHELKSERMASGILIEAWDGTGGNQSHYEVDGLMRATFSDN